MNSSKVIFSNSSVHLSNIGIICLICVIKMVTRGYVFKENVKTYQLKRFFFERSILRFFKSYSFYTLQEHTRG
jgi:hypothetical protein